MHRLCSLKCFDYGFEKNSYDCQYVLHYAVHLTNSPHVQGPLVNGGVVHLWSKKSGYNLRIGDHGDVSAKGRNGDYGEH